MSYKNFIYKKTDISNYISLEKIFSNFCKVKSSSTSYKSGSKKQELENLAPIQIHTMSLMLLGV